MPNEPTRKKGAQPGQGEEPEPSQTQSTTAQAGPSARRRQTQSGRQDEQQTGAEPEPEPEPRQHEFDATITQGCIDLVEAYRRGDKQRGVVLLGLAKRLGLNGDGEVNTAASAAFETYCTQLTEIDDARKGANSQPGSRGASPRAGEQEQEDDRGRSRMLGKSKGKRRADRSRSQSHSRSTRPSRSRSASPLSLSEDEPASKRRKPDSSEYAWAAVDATARKSLRPEVLDTLRRLKCYGRDIRSAKSHLLNSVGAPEFPDAEWSNVLRGKFVDLDHVFSGQYTLGVDEKHTEKFGPVELSYRAITPSKTVKSAGDWVIAWQRTTAAIVYAFPLRKADLDGYFAHIFELFGAIDPIFHSRVLDYDRAARQKAAAVRTILLTDLHEFSFLRRLYLDSIGASAAAPAGSSSDRDARRRTTSSRRVPSDEPCRRWNRGICNASDTACKYAHRCSACGASGHPATGCPKDGKRK